MLARIIIESSSYIDKIRDDVLLLLTPLPCDWKTLATALVPQEDFVPNSKGSDEANIKHLLEYHFSQHQKHTAVAKIVVALQNMSKSTDSPTKQLLEAMAKEIFSKHSKFACLSQ